MIMKKYLLIVFSLFFLMLSFNADAQRTGKKKRPKKEQTETTDNYQRSPIRTRKKEAPKKFTDNLNPEIKFGSIGGGSNGNYSVFALSLKGNVGYKFHKYFSAGVGGKFAYQYVNYSNSNASDNYTTYAGFGYLRAKYMNFYLQGEYVLERLPGFGTQPSANLKYPTLGFGYMNIGEKFSIGPEINFILKDDAVDRKGIYEYWINASYRF